MELCVIAMGGNLGNTAEIFHRAVDSLEHAGFLVRRVSSFLKTAPAGMAPGTPDFLNAVLTGEWNGTPRELLSLCQKIEAEQGRPNEHPHYVSRTLDLDIILFGKKKIEEDDLKVPHPLAKDRVFVRLPLQEIAPELIHLLWL